MKNLNIDMNAIGQGRMTYPNGSVYAGAFRDGSPNGDGSMTTNDRTVNVSADNGKLTRRFDAAELAETARAEEQRRSNLQQEQEQFQLRQQWQQEQMAAAQRQVSLCRAAMFGRSTKTGSFGESLSNAIQCDSDPNAHLIALPPSYVCRRDVRGNVQCDPQ